MKLSMRNKKRRLCFLLFLMVCQVITMVLGNSIDSYAYSSSLDVEVVVGYNNYVKYGSYAPVKVRISENNRKVGGRIELAVIFRDVEQYYYTAPFSSGKEETEVSFCVAIPNIYETEASMEIKILDEDGEELYQNRIGYQGNNQESQIYVGVLTDQYEGMDYWDELQMNEPYQLGGRTIPLSADEIPEDSQYLDMLDMILVKDFEEGQLNDDQTKAIEGWILDGGVLLVDGMDGVMDHEKEEEVFLYPFETLERNEGTISIHQKGKGRVVITDFDTEEFSYIIKNDGEGLVESFQSRMSSNELMEILMGKSSLQGIYQDGYRGISQVQSFFHNTVSADGIKVPTFGVYVTILIGYILVFVPCIYWGLKKWRHLEWLRVAILFLAILGSGIIFLAEKVLVFLNHLCIILRWMNIGKRIK